MLVVIASLADLALRVGRILDGRRAYAFSIEQLVIAAQREHPTVILLDVQLGGTSFRAVDVIPELQRLALGVSVIVITRAPTVTEKKEMVALGAYAFVDRLDDAFGMHLLERVRAGHAAARLQAPRRSRAMH